VLTVHHNVWVGEGWMGYRMPQCVSVEGVDVVPYITIGIIQMHHQHAVLLNTHDAHTHWSFLLHQTGRTNVF